MSKRCPTTGQFLPAYDGEFMQPETYHGNWQHIADTNEGNILCPEAYAEYRNNEGAAQAYNVPLENVTTEFGWGARLSASGYMDCTDWLGVYASEALALKALREMYPPEDEE